ncbi:hypothetical protein BQ8482_530039 [Mesorhizobium delmotii]|uniref:Uncharacterized protein n=1 Tax=Mesorhizobium delmotii TaxID=1631247 RepID=A0A2P9AUK6_9HYPH|nr:hypothetical protein BQ8482_530039 [Mesorhizobium delmotii]
MVETLRATPSATKTPQQYLHLNLQNLCDRKSLTMVPSLQSLRSGTAKKLMPIHAQPTAQHATEVDANGKKSAHPG